MGLPDACRAEEPGARVEKPVGTLKVGKVLGEAHRRVATELPLQPGPAHPSGTRRP